MEKEQNSKYYTEISGEDKNNSLKLKEVWNYRDLIWLFTKRSFVLKYKQTVLGPLWLFLNPIISSLIYCFIFGGIAKIGTDGVPQMLFYLSGNAIWTLFSTSLTSNASTFTANAGVFGKVYFPRLTTSISNILSSILQFFIQMIIVMVFLAVYLVRGEVHPNWRYWIFVPAILVVLGVLGMGVGIIISSLTTKYRDLHILVGFGVQLWMYITPVIYPLSEIENGKLRALLMVNPVTSLVEAFRYTILGQGEINFLAIAWSVLFTVVVTVCGIRIFNRVERTFMDTV